MVLSKPKGLALRFVDLRERYQRGMSIKVFGIASLLIEEDWGYAAANFEREKKWLLGKKSFMKLNPVCKY